jgi:predicted type IV restriction endonuclease
MLKLPKKFIDRVSSNLKRYQKIADLQRINDVAEADTVTLVKDILADVFGYDKYSELTSEFQIRGTYCDLAVKIDGKLKLLIEVKSAGTELNNNHLKQAVDYGAHKGILWVILTNGLEWRLVKIFLAGQINYEIISRFNILDINLKKDDELQNMFLIAREGVLVDAMDTYHLNSQLMNRYTVSEIVRSEPIVSAIRREMRRLFPEAKVTPEIISDFLVNEVIRRETFEGDKAKEAQDRIKKAQKKLLRAASKAALVATSEEVG